jgi:hypothetical protein
VTESPHEPAAPQPTATEGEAPIDQRFQKLEEQVDAERLQARLAALEAERDFRSAQERRFQELQSAVENVLADVRTQMSDTGVMPRPRFEPSEESEIEGPILSPLRHMPAPSAGYMESWLESWQGGEASPAKLELDIPATLRDQLTRLAVAEGLPVDRLCLSVLASWAGYRLAKRKPV